MKRLLLLTGIAATLLACDGRDKSQPTGDTMASHPHVSRDSRRPAATRDDHPGSDVSGAAGLTTDEVAELRHIMALDTCEERLDALSGKFEGETLLKALDFISAGTVMGREVLPLDSYKRITDSAGRSRWLSITIVNVTSKDFDQAAAWLSRKGLTDSDFSKTADTFVETVETLQTATSKNYDGEKLMSGFAGVARGYRELESRAKFVDRAATVLEAANVEPGVIETWVGDLGLVYTPPEPRGSPR